MTKSQRMKPVRRVAAVREESAAKDLATAQRYLQEQEQRLTELRTYHGEYVRQGDAAGRAGISAARFIELQRFLGNLQRAIEQQQQVVELAARTCEQKKQQWQQAHGKTKSLDKVVERYQEQERRESSQREQKESDEMAQHKGRRPEREENGER